MPKPPLTKPHEQPEVTFTLEMREKMRGPWHRRAGMWVSTTTWTIDLTQDEYATLAQSLRKARKAVRYAA